MYFFLWNCGFVLSQNSASDSTSFEQKLKVISLLTETEQYSEAMRQLKRLEESPEVYKSIENQVDYRLLIARVLRLSSQFDYAMHELSLLPNLDNQKELKIKVDFRRAALYMENPKYSNQERVLIVYPIIKEGIKTSLELRDNASLASFYSLNASMHYDECRVIKSRCKVNKKIAIDSYKKSMDLFLSLGDTLNYHNVLNGYFRVAIHDVSSEVDSLKALVIAYADNSTYLPNLIISRSLLAHYFEKIKNDSLSYFRQTLMEKQAMIDAVNKNADNTVGKLKLLYEFDSLKADLKLNKDVVLQKDLVIQEKNKRITDNIIYSIVLAILILILIILLIRQRVLTKSIKKTNKELNKSNHNYQLLIKESNHRIKNNLQMILSIIELDKEDANKDGQNILTSISSKILTIAALHKILDFKEHNQKVRLRIYFNEIINYFKDLTKHDVIFETDLSDSEIESERIIYFGLLLNEMISNTFKHRKTKDIITIKVLKSDKSCIFIYRDYSDFGDFEKNNGIFLIENLITRSGGWDLKFNPEDGEYKFYFNE